MEHLAPYNENLPSEQTYRFKTNVFDLDGDIVGQCTVFMSYKSINEDGQRHIYVNEYSASDDRMSDGEIQEAIYDEFEGSKINFE